MNMKKMFRGLRISVLAAGSLLLMSVLFTACDKNDDNTNVPAAGLMAVNLSTDLPASIALNGNYLTTGPLTYSTYTGGYYRVYPGTRQVQTYDYNTGTLADTGSFNFETDMYYSVFVLGANGSYENKIVHDDFDALNTTAGKAYIRYINAIPSSNPVVTVTANGTNTANTNASYGTLSDFMMVDAGDVTVDVDNGGDINANRTFAVEERGVYTALLIGTAGSTGADSVQIRYIKNGTLDADAGKMESVKSTGSQ